MMDTSCLDTIIVGRVEPHIYAFSTNTIPNYLKVGDTYRPVSLRLQEWKAFFPELEQQFEGSAKINDEIYFRDLAVHLYLEKDKGKYRLRPNDIAAGVYYSREFFKDTTDEDIKEAIDDITRDYCNSGNRKYQFYNAQDRLPAPDVYPRTETFELRSNQKETVERFNEARANGRTDLLMYAVMRFGKSFTAMCCALEMKARLVVVVSAKADVRDEWRKTVQSHMKFAEYVFVNGDNLAGTDLHDQSKKFVVFLTLQDLQGDAVKDKHKELLQCDVDLLLVDETHFGARAEEYGKVLKGTTHKFDEDDFIDAKQADESIKGFKAKITMHLSGTPYRILMGSEFQKEDVIAFYQFSDIVAEQKKWDEENRQKPEAEAQEDWGNPYYGFPEMIRFAFNPNESSRKRLKKLKENGKTDAFSALLEPVSTTKNQSGSHKKFKYEREILELLQVIDGSRNDEELLGFLDYDKIKKGQMCRHIVMVLPFCASCDAMETLLKSNRTTFKNLGEYEIINISGVESPGKYKSPEDVKKAIEQCEKNGQKTLTLTVNRMLTGSTVPEWDTMLYLKDTASPQEYDQAIFRLQNQFIKTYKEDKTPDGDEIKYNMKPQTLLVDFMPGRMFRMQELKSQIYNVNTDEFGNSHLRDRLTRELEISPIIVFNKDKLVQVEANDILKAVSEYSQSRGVADEVREIPVDLSLLDIEEVRRIIEKENALGSKAGLSVTAHQGEETDVDSPDGGESGPDTTEKTPQRPAPGKAEEDTAPNRIKQFQTFYARVLFFAFLTKNEVKSLGDIIACMDEGENSRIMANLGIDRAALIAMQKMNWAALRAFDYKIQNINTLSNDGDADPLTRCKVAITKFGKLSEAEIVTPDHICDAMVSLIPDDEWRRLVDRGDKVLDIACKVGEFPMAICRKLESLGYQPAQFAKIILAVPTSSVAYEFTRRIYEELGLDLSCLAAKFTAYDLLEVKKANGRIDYESISSILKQNKPFDSIALNDPANEGEEKLNIEFVVSNPPYQEKDGSGGSNDASLYQYFVQAAHSLSPAYVSIIMPSRWFSGGRENLLGEFRRDMLNRAGIKSLFVYPDAREVFDNVEIKGGICYYLYDKNHAGRCTYTLSQAGKKSVSTRILNELEVLVRDPQVAEIVKKVMDKLEDKSAVVASIISGDTPFGIPTKPQGSKKDNFRLYETEGKNHTTKLYYIEKQIRKTAFLDKNSIRKNADDIDKIKVFIPEASGSGYDPQVLGQPEYAEKNSVCSQSYLYAPFDSEAEALSFISYLKTKFFRLLISACKISQHTSSKVYRFVPIQDFTLSSDIDWSVAIPEIDQQLYKKYGLSADEIAFIESHIKPME